MTSTLVYSNGSLHTPTGSGSLIYMHRFSFFFLFFLFRSSLLSFGSSIYVSLPFAFHSHAHIIPSCRFPPHSWPRPSRQRRPFTQALLPETFGVTKLKWTYLSLCEACKQSWNNWHARSNAHIPFFFVRCTEETGAFLAQLRLAQVELHFSLSQKLAGPHASCFEFSGFFVFVLWWTSRLPNPQAPGDLCVFYVWSISTIAQCAVSYRRLEIHTQPSFLKRYSLRNFSWISQSVIIASGRILFFLLMRLDFNLLLSLYECNRFFYLRHFAQHAHGISQPKVTNINKNLVFSYSNLSLPDPGSRAHPSQCE